MKMDHSLPLEYSTKQNDLKYFWILDIPWMLKSCLFATLFTSYFTLEHRIGSGPIWSRDF